MLVLLLKRTPPSDPATWKSLVQSANGQQGLDRVSTLVASVALRRTKDMTTDDGSSVLGIPAKHVKVCFVSSDRISVFSRENCYYPSLKFEWFAHEDTPKAKYLDFSADERRFYRLLRKHSRSSYDRMMSESGGGKMNYSRVLVMLLRLRQVCWGPLYISTVYRHCSLVKLWYCLFNSPVRSLFQASSHYGLITGDDGRRVNWDAPQDVLTRAARAVGLCDPDADLDPAAAAGSEEEQKVAPEADAEADELEKMLSSLAISGSADNTDGVECAVWVECAVCLEPIAALKPMERRTTPCGHTFCRECITQAIVGANEAGEAGSCPSCHTAVTLQSLDVTSNPAPPTPVANSTQHGKKQQVRRIPRKVAPIRRSASAEPEVEAQPKIKRGELERDAPLPDFESPLDRIKSGAKVAYLLQKLRVVKAKDPDEKSIVFSQWTSMLSLLEEVLDAEGIGYVRLDGTMTTAAQDDAIARFNNDDDVSVFLISLKAGGVGLNLTRASRVFLMDIWWNPAIETQAMDRVHRVGQTREVFVYRLLMKDSVEERIESLQERKNMLAQGALADNKGKRAFPQPAKLSFSMLKDLFKAI